MRSPTLLSQALPWNIFNFNPFIGAFAFLAKQLSSLGLSKNQQPCRSRPSSESFVLALAIGILITPQVNLLEALFGDVSKITLTDTIITVLVFVCVIIVTKAIYPKLAVSMILKNGQCKQDKR